MAQIICLANSYKTGGRCIAGIDIETGEWIRPVPENINKAIRDQRMINGREPKLLDILEIPVENYGPDERCQPENRLLKRGRWTRKGRLKPRDLLKYCEDDSIILHNHKDRVPPDEFSQKPKCKWKSLQLIHSKRVDFYQNPWGKWCVSFSYGDRQCLELKLTDPILLSRLSNRKTISRSCILTISLGTPFRRQPSDIEFCWKMVAGVVEL